MPAHEQKGVLLCRRCHGGRHVLGSSGWLSSPPMPVDLQGFQIQLCLLSQLISWFTTCEDTNPPAQESSLLWAVFMTPRQPLLLGGLGGSREIAKKMPWPGRKWRVCSFLWFDEWPGANREAGCSSRPHGAGVAFSPKPTWAHGSARSTVTLLYTCDLVQQMVELLGPKVEVVHLLYRLKTTKTTKNCPWSCERSPFNQVSFLLLSDGSRWSNTKVCTVTCTSHHEGPGTEGDQLSQAPLCAGGWKRSNRRICESFARGLRTQTCVCKWTICHSPYRDQHPGASWGFPKSWWKCTKCYQRCSTDFSSWPALQ